MEKAEFFDESTEQSRIKMKLVADYFGAWSKVILPSVKRANGKLAYIDLFAGPGRYADGIKSTPLLVIEQAVANPAMHQHFVTIFNDKDPANADLLRKSIGEIEGINRLKFPPIVMTGEVGGEAVKRFEQMKLVPTLLFVDPWGYKGLSLGLINAVLKDWGCDCIIFFNYNRVNMGLGNAAVAEHLDVLFGQPRASDLRTQIEGLAPQDREATIVEALAEALKGLGAPFVLPFCFKDDRGKRTSHHLILATKHGRGYGIMKEIMARSSSEQHQGVASFAYCPASAIHPLLFELNRPLDQLEDLLMNRFAGRTMQIGQIYEEHNVGTPYILKNYRAALLKLEEKGLISTSPSKRRKGTFSEKVRATFPHNPAVK